MDPSARMVSLSMALTDGAWECDLTSGRFSIHGPLVQSAFPDPPPDSIDTALAFLEPWEATALRRGLAKFLQAPAGVYEQEVWLRARPESLRIRALVSGDGTLSGAIHIVPAPALLPEQALIDTSREAIIVTDLAGRPARANRLGRQWFSLPHDQDPWWPKLRAFAKDQKAFDRALCNRLGCTESLEFHLDAGLIVEGNQSEYVIRRRKLGWIWRFRDVTEHRRTMDDLTTAKERLELGLIGTNDGVFDWDLRTNQVYASRISGNPTTEDMDRWVHPDDRAHRDAAARAHFEHNQPYDVEFRSQSPGQPMKWFRARGAALRDAEGRPYRFVGCFTDITAKQEAVEALRRLEQEHRTVLAQIQDVVFELDTEGNLRYLNPAWTYLLGHDTESCLRRPLLDFVDPGDHPIVQQQLRTEAGSAQPLECRWICSDGQHRWLELRPGRVEDSEHNPLVFGTLVDVEARRLARAASERARRMAEEASRTKTEFLAAVSHELRTPLNVIVGSSELLQDMPLSPDALHFSEVIGSNSRMLARLINDLLDVSRIEAGQIDIKSQPFDPVQVLELVCEQFRSDAQAKGLSLDLTLAEAVPDFFIGDPDRLRQIVANLVGNAIKFTNRGSVEIELGNRPHGGMEVLVRDTGTGIPREALDRIFEKFVRLENGSSNNRTGVGLGLTISKQLAERMGGVVTVESAPGKGTSFSVSLPLTASEDVKLIGFPGLVGLRVAIYAAGASFSRSLSLLLLRARATALVFESMECLYECLMMGSCDAVLLDGPALQSALLPDVLRLARTRDIPVAECAASSKEPVHQLWKTLDRPFTRSRIGQFVATAAVYSQSIGARNAKEHRASSMRVLNNPPHILLVDDLTDSLEVNCALLRRCGYHVDTASSGTEAVAMTEQSRCHLVLMDVEMPDFDGMEATRRIRLSAAAGGRPYVPIIALTAHAAKEFREHCLAAGMDDYLAKPVSVDELRAKIEQWIPSTPLIILLFPGAPPHLSLPGCRRAVAPDAEQALVLLRELHVAAIVAAPELAVNPELRAEAQASNIPVISWNGQEPDLDQFLWTEPLPDSGLRSKVPPEITALIPRYLDNRLRDVHAIEEALEKEDFFAVQRIAHNLKGSGTGYGYSQLSALGRELESMAKTGARQRILELSAELERQVRQLRGALPV